MRLLLVLPFGWWMARPDSRSAAVAGGLIAAAIATDVLDGKLARRLGSVSSLGGLLDHTADCLFVTTGLAAGAFRRAFPWILPVLVAAAFLQYVADSRWIHRRRGLLGSRLGRVNGILYFAPLCFDVAIRLGIGFLHPVLDVLVWALVGSTLVSMLERLSLKPRP